MTKKNVRIDMPRRDEAAISLRRIEPWLEDIRTRAHFKARPIPLEKSREWRYADGAIRHNTGKFFSIIGVRYQDAAGKMREQPLIEQREIGLLGFLSRTKEKNKELLVQAKLEPGNIGLVQLAPTCQATKSNATQAHGGKIPPMVETFKNARDIYMSTLQSEHGFRFMGKRNKNILAEAPAKLENAPFHRWIGVDDVLSLAGADFVLNTDARSVLISSTWHDLVGRRPFSRYDTDFGRALSASANAPTDERFTSGLMETVQQHRVRAAEVKVIPLEILKGWKFNKASTQPLQGRDLLVRHLQIKTRGREVPEWDQPFIQTLNLQHFDLFCTMQSGLLRFLFVLQSEPGLLNRAELTVTATSADQNDFMKGKIIAQCLQSEEGGRFYQDKSLYRIVLVPSTGTPIGRGHWLSLAQIQQLLVRGGYFTNEARSALSLLLPWM